MATTADFTRDVTETLDKLTDAYHVKFGRDGGHVTQFWDPKGENPNRNKTVVVYRFPNLDNRGITVVFVENTGNGDYCVVCEFCADFEAENVIEFIDLVHSGSRAINPLINPVTKTRDPSVFAEKLQVIGQIEERPTVAPKPKFDFHYGKN